MVRAPPLCRPPIASTEQGFSLVELIVVIVITGIIASVVGLFITGPIQGFIDQSRRAELVDAAQLALTRMGRDLRGSLPNSVRINATANTMELLLTTDGDRYRAEVPGTAADVLTFDAADESFNTLAPLSPPSPVPATYSVIGALAIYPLQQSGANPYVASDGVMTPSGEIDITRVTNNSQFEYQVSLTSAGLGAPGAHRFTFDSPSRRVFLVSGPVTWMCDVVNRQLLRYDGYGVTATQPEPPVAAATVIVGNLQSCAFRYSPGTAQRNAVVSIALSLAHPAALDERVRLLRQIHVSNTP